MKPYYQHEKEKINPLRFAQPRREKIVFSYKCTKVSVGQLTKNDAKSKFDGPLDNGLNHKIKVILEVRR